MKTEDIVFDKRALQNLGLLQPLEEKKEAQEEERTEGREGGGQEANIMELTALAAGRKAGASTATAAVEMITLRQLESHGDQVLLLPPGAVPLATSGMMGEGPCR